MTYTNNLVNLAKELSIKRVNINNKNNGYAYLSCIVLDKKKPYCVLQSWDKSL